MNEWLSTDTICIFTLQNSYFNGTIAIMNDHGLALEIQNLSKTYPNGTKALNGISSVPDSDSNSDHSTLVTTSFPLVASSQRIAVGSMVNIAKSGAPSTYHFERSHRKDEGSSSLRGNRL